MYSELIKQARDVASESETPYLSLEAQLADALESQAKELAARELVIQQMRTALSDIQIGYALVEKDEVVINARKALAIQPSTTYLDAYVAERTKEMNAEIEQWKCNSRENKLIAEQCERRNAAQSEALKHARALAIRAVDLLESYQLYGPLRADLEEFAAINALEIGE